MFPILTAPVSPPDLPVANLSPTRDPLFFLSVRVQSFGSLEFFFPLTSGLSYPRSFPSLSVKTSSIIPGAFNFKSSIAEIVALLVLGPSFFIFSIRSSTDILPL